MLETTTRCSFTRVPFRMCLDALGPRLPSIIDCFPSGRNGFCQLEMRDKKIFSRCRVYATKFVRALLPPFWGHDGRMSEGFIAFPDRMLTSPGHEQPGPAVPIGNPEPPGSVLPAYSSRTGHAVQSAPPTAALP